MRLLIHLQGRTKTEELLYCTEHETFSVIMCVFVCVCVCVCVFTNDCMCVLCVDGGGLGGGGVVGRVGADETPHTIHVFVSTMQANSLLMRPFTDHYLFLPVIL